MTRKMLVDAVHPEETRVVITDNKSSILEFDFTTAAKPQIKGNVYLAKVTRVEPSLQAAFVEYGGGKQGFLPFSEIHPNYYQIPVSDRQKLIEEEEAEMAQQTAEEEEEIDIEADETDEMAEGEDEEASDAEDGESDSIAAEVEDDGESVSSDEITDTEEKPKPKRRGRPRKKAAKQEEESAKTENSEATKEDEKTEEKPKPKRRGRKKKTDVETDTEAEDTAKDTSDEKAEASEDSDADESENETERKRGRRRRGGRGRGRDRRRRGSRAEGEENGEIETVSGDDDMGRRRRKRSYLRRYKIQEVIKRNQVLLVQVVKEERGNKGVSLTTFLSLAGRYCVLMPNSGSGGGVSRKIANGEDRKRLKKTLADMTLPKGMSVIIRTAGAGHTRAEIKRDFDYLVKLWNQIREDTLEAEAPALIYEESNIIQRTIRDSYNTDIEQILVDGEQAFKDTKAFMRKLIPSHAPKVKQYKGDTPLFHKERIEEQLLSMTEPEVRLPSGGSIVMTPTEALISIDVNSGRANREKSVEETALKTNLEAARVVARQLRLRDLAGLVVIDFIDMMEGKNRRAVERAMKEALRSDRAKIQVGRISSFGLLEMSRQRMRPSIAESINRACPHCQGTGTIRSEAALGIQIIRALEKEASVGHFDRFRVSVTATEAVYILNNMRGEVDTIEEQFDCTVEIVIDGTLHEGDFRVEKFRRKGDNKKSNRSDNESKDEAPSRNRGKRGGRGRNRKDKTDSEEGHDNEEKVVVEEAPFETNDEAEVEAKEEKPKRRGRKKKEEEVEVDTEATEQAEKPKRRGRPRKKAEAEEAPTADEASAPTEAANDSDAETKDKPKKPKRSGWWQKIVE